MPILAIQSTTNLLITHPDTYFEHQVNILPYLHHQRSEYQDTTHSKDPGKQHVQRPFLGATRAFSQTIKREVRPNPCQPTMVQVGNFFSPQKNRNWNICSMEIPLYSLDTLFSLHVHLLVKMSSHQKPDKRKLQKTKVDFHVNCLRHENKHITGTYMCFKTTIMVILDNFGRIHDDLIMI